MTLHVLTQQLTKVYDVLLANIGSYGSRDDEREHLTLSLRSGSVRTIHVSTLGLFALERSVSSSKRFGFRVRPIRSTASVELVEALQRANDALLALDTKDPRQVCAQNGL